MVRFEINRSGSARVLADLLTNREEFNTDHDSIAGVVASEDEDEGKLSGAALQTFRNNLPRMQFIVYSYATPIAWRLDDGKWQMPKVAYSTTTSKHQAKVNYAFTLMGVTPEYI